MVRAKLSRLLSLLIAMVLVIGLMPALPHAAAAAEPDPGARPTQAMGSADDLPSHVSSDSTEVGDDAVRDKQRSGSPAKGNAKDKPARPVELVKPDRRETAWSVDRDEPVGQPAGFDPDSSRERPDLGGPRRQVFENADGTLTARNFGARQMFEVPGQGWRRIDPTLVAQSNGEGWRSRADADAKVFARSANARQLVSVDLADGNSYGFGVSGARGAIGSVDGDTATYPQVRPGADLVLQATPGGVKETIVLHSAEAPTEWAFPLTLDGLTARLADAGSVELVDAEGDVAAVIPPGFMEDSNIDERSADGVRSHAVTYRLTEEAGRQVLHVSVDAEWLRDPARVFPVLVDPSVQKESNGDTYVLSPYTNDYSGESILKLGTYNGGGNKARAFIKFGTVSSDLSGMKILDTRLGLYNVWSYSCSSRAVNVYPVTEGWSSTGNKSYPGPSLGTKLASKSFSYGHADNCGAKWAVIDLGSSGDSLVQGWVRGKANYGLGLTGSETDSYAWKKFASSNTVNAPYLAVTYSPYWAEYTVGSMTTAPTATTDGVMRVTVKNDGKDTWTASSAYDLGYKLWDTVSGKELGDADKARTNMTQSVATGQSIALDAKIKALPPGKYKLRWDMVKTGSFWFSTQGVPWSYRVYFEVPNQLPHATSMTPLSGYRPDTLRPVLRMTGTDPDNYPGTGLNYQFAVCDSAGANCTLSAQQSATYWRVSADRMAWSQTYTWKTRVHDGGQWGPWSGLAVLKPEVPQPSVTSHLAGKPDSGVDPGVANFTTSTTDTAIAVVGPDLAVTRTYNSSDPRKSLAFGSGWSTRWDAGLVPDDDGSGNVVITYPNGRQARFGLNPDGSYAAPAGKTDILVSTAAGGWKLRTVGNIRYEFDSNGDLVTITDARGRAQQLTYTAGQLSEAKDAASGRSLTFTWTSGHVTKVSTGPSPVLTWTYAYSGDRLTQACNPEAECTDYGWVDGNGYRTAVTDSNPAGYWRLADADTGAVASEVPGLGKNLAGTANAIADDPSGPVAGNGLAAATFNGSSSYVKFDDNPLIDARYRSVQLWFKTSSTQGGVLVNTSKFAPGQTGPSGSMPALYVGTNGILYGHFCNGQTTGITSPAPVNNGAWHHVVLSQAEGKQWMYLDGQLAGSQDTGQWCGGYTKTYLGAGLVTTNSWPNRPVNDWGYFDGSIAEAAAYTRPVTAVEASEHHQSHGVVRFPPDRRGISYKE